MAIRMSRAELRGKAQTVRGVVDLERRLHDRARGRFEHGVGELAGGACLLEELEVEERARAAGLGARAGKTAENAKLANGLGC